MDVMTPTLSYLVVPVETHTVSPILNTSRVLVSDLEDRGLPLKDSGISDLERVNER